MDEIIFLFPAIEVWEWKTILSHTLECNYVSMLLLRWIHVSKIGPDDSFIGSVGNLILTTSAATTLLYIARIMHIVGSHFVVPDSKVHGANMGPPGSCRPQIVPILAPWTLLSGVSCLHGWMDPRNSLCMRNMTRKKTKPLELRHMKPWRLKPLINVCLTVQTGGFLIQSASNAKGVSMPLWCARDAIWYE